MATTDRIEELTVREAQVLAMQILGSGVRATAHTLSIEPETVVEHRATIRRKVGLPRAATLPSPVVDRDTVFSVIRRLCAPELAIDGASIRMAS